MAKILLGIPTYKKECHADLLFKMHFMTQGGKNQVAMGNVDSSAICLTMNSLWVQALEAYQAGEITHFAMLHTDIVPENYFMDKMVEIMEREGAEILSAIVPIKNAEGFTSTAVEGQMGDTNPYFRVKRFSMRELDKLPATFTHPEILLNTGLMLVDLSKPWTLSEDVYFTIEDRIIKYRGRRIPAMWPEDWGFSRRARKAGATKLYATREVKLDHAGLANFPNYVMWGEKDTDVIPCPPMEFVTAANKAADIRGFMAWEELAWLAQNAKGKEVVEIGSWLGRSTMALASTAERVWAVDHWKGSNDDLTREQAKQIKPYAEFCHNLGVEINTQKVIPVMADHSAETFGMAEMFAELGGHEWAPDFCFIDGDHAEAAVRRDIQSALKLLKRGGMLCGHDFTEAHPGVIAAVKDLVPTYQVANGTTIWYSVVPALVNA